MGARLAEEILTALDAQSVTVPGSNAAEIVLPGSSQIPLKEVLQQRKSIAEDVERMLDDHPLSQVLMSMPGVGVRTAARSCSRSVTARRSPLRRIWRPTPVSPW